MDAISYEYTKPRSEFGRRPQLSDSAVTVASIATTQPTKRTAELALDATANALDGNAPPLSPSMSLHLGDENTAASTNASSASLTDQWIEALSTTVELNCIPLRAAHEVNTERYVTLTKGVTHTDGAWPTEVKTNEAVDRQRYVRRITNEPSFQSSVVSLSRTADDIIAQTNTIDLYEEYFTNSVKAVAAASTVAGAAAEPTAPADTYESSPPSARTLCVFRDPSNIKRVCTKLSWHPDGANKVAVAYSFTQFQSNLTVNESTLASYIWDVSAPNSPDAKLLPTSPLTTLAYNPRSPDQLVGGCYNGLLAFFDLRKGSNAVETSLLEGSHHDPVVDVHWIQSRSGNECCSLSTDGQLLWWDIRKLKQGATDRMTLVNDGDATVKYGGTSLEYKSDAGATRFLLGTEQGVSLLADRKAKKDSESQKSLKSAYGNGGGGGIHHGPIYCVARNPFNVKYFLTVGDWSTKIWMEDLRSPIITSAYDTSYITSACWSTTRPAVYYTSKTDGTMDVWDLYERIESPVYTVKISDAKRGLSSIKVHSNGRLIALGDTNGTTTIASVSRGLVDLQKDEKSIISALFERETKREKNLDIKLAQKSKNKAKDSEAPATSAANASSENDGVVLPTTPAVVASTTLTLTAEETESTSRAETDFFASLNESDAEQSVTEKGSNEKYESEEKEGPSNDDAAADDDDEPDYTEDEPEIVKRVDIEEKTAD